MSFWLQTTINWGLIIACVILTVRVNRLRNRVQELES